MNRRLLLVAGLALGLAGLRQASADQVPLSCTVLPDGQSASLMLTNPFDRESSCLATCQFSTARYDIRPQITCTKPVPAHKEVQMCILMSQGEKLVALMNSSGDCIR
jgi:hypothetical protein